MKESKMSDSKKKKKEYEPPLIKEIGESFEQAMGVSDCLIGSTFTIISCVNGWTAVGGCSVGQTDKVCAIGVGDVGSCSRGHRATGACITGPSTSAP
jgi:hypothetical protein